MYWFAPLNSDNLARYQNDPGVRSVAKSGDLGEPPTPVKRTAITKVDKRAITSQTPAPSALRMITQATGQPAFPDGYYYDESAGSNIHLYVIDSGVNPDHKDFADTEISWRFAGPFATTTEADDSIESPGHGTCMASCAVGAFAGVAKKSKLTLVKMSLDFYNKLDIGLERGIDALAQVYDAIQNDNEQGKAVVSMSWGASPPRNPVYNDPVHDTYVKLLKAIIIDLDVPALASAGNHAFPNPEVAHIPAILAGKDVPDLVAVGAVDYDGVALHYTQRSDFVKVFAPGEDIDCAEPGGGYKVETGTSPATAYAAGLVAYFMGQGQTGADARLHLINSAYPRREKAVKTIWNDVDTRQLEQAAPPPPAPPAPAPPAPPAPAYAEGTCSFHLLQRRSGPIARFGVPIFTVEVTMHDNNGAEIGHLDEQSASKGIGMTSKLEWILIIKAKGVTGGIDFAYSDQKWDDGTHGDDLPTCKRGDWDVTDGGDKANRQMDCNFSCKH